MTQFDKALDSCCLAPESELLVLYSSCKGRLGTVQLSALGDDGVHSIEECEESLQLMPQETVKDYLWIQKDRGDMALLTNQRLLTLSKDLTVVSQMASHEQWLLVGANCGCALLSDEHWLYYLQPTGQCSQLVKIASMDRRIEKPLGMAIDRLVVARLTFDHSDKSAKLEIQQRYALFAELLFEGALRAGQGLEGKYLEAVVGVLWDAHYSDPFVDRVAEKGKWDSLSLDFARKCGKIGRVLENIRDEDCSVFQDFVKQNLKDYLLSSDFGNIDISSLRGRSQSTVFCLQTRAELKRKIEYLNRRQLLGEELSWEGLSEAVGRLESLKRSKLLKKTEVCFGQELYL